MTPKIIIVFIGLLILGLAIGMGIMTMLETPPDKMNPIGINELRTQPSLPAEGVVIMEEVVEKTAPEVPEAIVVDEIDPDSQTPSVIIN
jgi:hypothetical protein